MNWMRSVARKYQPETEFINLLVDKISIVAIKIFKFLLEICNVKLASGTISGSQVVWASYSHSWGAGGTSIPLVNAQ